MVGHRCFPEGLLVGNMGLWPSLQSGCHPEEMNAGRPSSGVTSPRSVTLVPFCSSSFGCQRESACVCVCVCAHVYICVCMCIPTCACVYVHVCTPACTLYVHVHVHMCVHVCVQEGKNAHRTPEVVLIWTSQAMWHLSSPVSS